MDDIIKALATTNIWTIAIAVIVVVASSSAAGAWISSGFQSRTASKGFRREVRRAALESVGRAYSLYLKYGNQEVSLTDSERVQLVSEASALMRTAVAATGDRDLLDESEGLVALGELFASSDEATSVAAVDEAFIQLARTLAAGIPAK